MKILGIHHRYHDSGACVVHDDRLTCISEERLNRQKQTSEFPILAVRYCLGSDSLQDVDLVVVDDMGLDDAESFREILRQTCRDVDGVEIRLVNHHASHAASVFWVGPFDEAAVLVVDGYGSMRSDSGETLPGPETHSIYHASAEGIKLMHKASGLPGWKRGIGMAYTDATLRLGFRLGQEGKTMGLAAYAKAPRDSEPLFERTGGQWGVRDDHPFLPHDEIYSNPVAWIGGPPDGVEESRATIGGLPPRVKPMPEVDPIYAPFSAFIQDELERAMCALAEEAKRLTGCKNLCIAGGCGLNSVANTKVRQTGLFENVFVQPASSDVGIPLGNALWGYHEVHRRPKSFCIGNACLGKPYSNERILSALQNSNMEWRSFENDEEAFLSAVAQLLSQSEIVGWFQGASEFGPRALGYRSILADPRRAESKTNLNAKIKFREGWRPFAPSVLEEEADRVFDSPAYDPHMLSVVPVREEWKDRIPSVTHVDGTARFQTVDSKTHPFYYRLISKFHDLTGIPLVVNTSFNRAGEPIVETPEDAINSLMKSELQWLAIGSCVAVRPERKEDLIGLSC